MPQQPCGFVMRWPRCLRHSLVRASRRRGNGSVLLLGCCAGFTLLLAALQAEAALAEPPRVEPSPEEQLLIYELNRARSNPSGYALEQGLGDILEGAPSLPPLAVNEWLTAGAREHAEEMAVHDYFDHQSAITGRWPNEKARDAGYPLPADWPDERNFIESLAAGYPSSIEALRALIEDEGFNPPGHRYHLLALGPDREFWRSHREVGAGYAFEEETVYGDYYVLHTATSDDPWPFVTGVVYEDRNESGRYDLNEGLGGVEVIAYGGDGVAARTTTNDAGGFSLPLLPGFYTIRVGGGEFYDEVEVDITLGGENMHLAFQSAPVQPEFAVERDFEFQAFEPRERPEREEQPSHIAGNVERDADNESSESSERGAEPQRSTSGFTATRGCSIGGAPNGRTNSFTPLGGLAVLLLFALAAVRRNRS